MKTKLFQVFKANHLAMFIHHHDNINNNELCALHVLNPMEYLRHIFPLYFIFLYLCFLDEKTEVREGIEFA